MDEAAAPVLAVRGLTRHFDVSQPWLERALGGGGRRVLRAVDGISFQVPRGATLALVGESGCGKSTVARCITNLVPTTSGTIEFCFDGRTRQNVEELPRATRRKVQMIFQDPYGSLNPRWSVGRIVAEPLKVFGLASGAQARAEVARLLDSVGLAASDARKFPHEFSGGQRQRVSIARALAAQPDFLVCDEPTSALDVSVQAQVLNILRDLQARLALTYVFISHDLSAVFQMSDAVGVMYLGRIVELRRTEPLFRSPRHPYTQLLLDAVPLTDVIGEVRAPLAGEVPSPIDPPPGCPFHPRCPFANDRCRGEVPALLAVGDGEVACHGVEEGRLPR